MAANEGSLSLEATLCPRIHVLPARPSNCGRNT